MRDPALQSLGLVLDEERLGFWLSDRMGGCVHLRSHYLRYKQGTGCVLAADLETAGKLQPCLLSVHPGGDRAKLLKTVERAPRGSVLAVDHTRGLLATTPAADRDLPALARLADEGRRRRLLRTLLGDRHGIRGATVQTLRHKPHRRWVGLVDLAHDGPKFVVRAYRPGESRGAVEAVDACTAVGAPTPRLVGADTRRGVAVVDYVHGGVLSRLGGDRQRVLEGFCTAGAALRRLHDSVDVRLRSTSPAAEAHAVRAAAAQLAVLLRDDADGVHELASDLAARLFSLEPVRVPLHGDFSADQVVVGSTGAATLIDLDSVRLGDPASDLGCAAAAITRDVVLGRVPEATGEAWLQALHDGYYGVSRKPDEERLAVHRAAHLFRRAVEPFRLRQTADWPDATRELLARARHTLDTRSVVDGIG